MTVGTLNQVSVLKDIAAQFGLEPFVPVTVQRVEPRDVTVDFIELTFKDQFLSRADIWRFKVAMLGKCVYVGKHVACLGVRSQVEGLLANNQDHACGVIGAETKMIVRSRSSRLFWLVQMSAEMWEFAPDGELYYEKLLDRLLRVMISKWHESSVSHSVTIIAFSRSFYDKQQFPDDYDPRVPPFSEPTRQSSGAAEHARSFSSTSPATGRGPTIQVDPLTGRYYEDFYKVLVMNYTGPDWDHLLGVLKREFTNYHETHRWRSPEESIPAEYVVHDSALEGPTPSPTELSDKAPLVLGDTNGDGAVMAAPTLDSTARSVHWTALPFGIPSRAIDGNILEAINVTLNILDKHYMDRDLHRTGQSIVMITAGCSIFHVDERLAQITKQRMMDNGVGMDMISLTTPPMHVVPLFIYQKTASHATTSFSQTFPSPTRDQQQQHVLDESVRRQRNYSISSETLDACSLEGLEKELSELEPSGWSTHANTGDGDDSDSNAAPSETLSHDGEAANASQMPQQQQVPQTVYSIPHWVNITFLDFDCRCRNGTASSIASAFARGAKHASAHSDSAGTTRSQFNNRLLSHRTQTCECQCYLNQRFLPLPPCRMFDITAPTERLAFPVALKRLIPGYPRRIERGAALSPSSAIANADEYSEETAADAVGTSPRRRRLSDMSDALSIGSSTGIDVSAASAWQSDHVMICRSPDYDSVLTRSPRLAPFTSAYGAAVLSHDAFQEYDDEVFSTRAILRGKQSSSFENDDASGAGLLAPQRSAHDLTSATFSGDTTALDAAMAAAAGDAKLSKWHAPPAHGRVSGTTAAAPRRGFNAKGSSSSSMIGSLLSPRNDVRVFHQQSRTAAARGTGAGSSSKPTLALKRVATVNELSTPATATAAAARATSGIRIPTLAAHGSGRSTNGFRTHELSSTAKADAFDEQARSPDDRHHEGGDGTAAAALDGKLLSKSVDVATSRSFLLAAHKDASATESNASVQRQRACTSNVETTATPPLVTPPTGRNGSFQHLSRSMTMTKPSPSYYNDLLLRSPPPPGPPALTSSLSTAAHYDSHFARTGYYPPGAMRRGHSDVLASSMLTALPPQAPSSPPQDRPQACVSTNPFRYSTETLEGASQRLTSDRRRWSHLFPVLTTNQQASIGASDVHHHGGVKPIHLGPNWKSLTSPAILPLTTDYYPSAKDLHTSYTESFYTLTLPSMQSETVPKYNDHDELLIEMVCQRLASDFQLVATDASTDSDAGTLLHHHHHHHHHAPTGAPGTPSRSNTVVYYLSMGHRIHQMIYDAELQTIDVKRYFQRAIERQKTDAKTYRYSLYVDRTASFHPLQQTFYEYAQPEENWNSLDHLLCGYHDEMSDATKCRRIRFAIVPPRDAATSATARAAYVAKVGKLIDYFQTRIAPAEDGVVEKIVVRAVASPALTPSENAPLPPPSPQTLRYKICCKSSSCSSARSKSDDTRAEWIMLTLEDTLDVARTYHLDMRWLACSGIIADEFVSALKRKSKQSGLELRRVPEYSRVSFLQIHPLIAPIFLPLPPWPHRDNVSSLSAERPGSSPSTRATEQERLLIATLVDRLDFVFDDERLADANGIGYGLGIEREERKPLGHLGAGYRHHRRSASTAARLLAAKWETRGYRQYMHRSAPVFLRLVHRGLVWIPSYDYDEKSDVARVDELFREICRVLQASAALHDMVESCCCTEAA